MLLKNFLLGNDKNPARPSQDDNRGSIATITGSCVTRPSKRRNSAEAPRDTDERAIYSLIRALQDENPGVQDASMRPSIAISDEVTAYEDYHSCNLRLLKLFSL
jgi:hypothetical protein